MKVKLFAYTLVLIFTTALSARAQGGTTVPGYVSCNTVPGGDTVYFSALFEVVPGRSGDTGGYQAAFADMLRSKYNVTDRVTCGYAYKPTADLQHLSDGQRAIEAQWRSNGKKVVDTGWTWNGAPALNRQPAAAPAPAAPPPPSAAQTQYEKALEAERPRSATATRPKAAGSPSSRPPTTPSTATATAPGLAYGYCFATGAPSASHPNYYVSTLFTLPPTSHPEGAFQKFLRAQYPKEQFGSTECRRGSSSDVVTKGRSAFVTANSDRYKIVDVDWQP
ncbi:MAG TPA: hypothetical protein VI216_04705 [Candidatus Acidoferrales bacterium]